MALFYSLLLILATGVIIAYLVPKIQTWEFRMPDPSASWEANFLVNRRSTVANIVLASVRHRRYQGLSLDPKDIADDVCIDLTRRLYSPYADHATLCWLRDFMGFIESDPDGFHSYILYRIGWDSHDRSAKARLRATGDARPSSEKPPSANQLRFLASLGYRGAPPATMAEASERINEALAVRQ